MRFLEGSRMIMQKTTTNMAELSGSFNKIVPETVEHFIPSIEYIEIF